MEAYACATSFTGTENESLKRGPMEEDTVFIPDWAWDSTIPLSEIIIATEPGSTRPGSRGFASWCSLNKIQADKFGINYGMGNPNGAKELLKKVEEDEKWNDTNY